VAEAPGREGRGWDGTVGAIKQDGGDSIRGGKLEGGPAAVEGEAMTDLSWIWSGGSNLGFVELGLL
jgi:hypothetical protein